MSKTGHKMLTIAYNTFRQEPHIDWFWSSLRRENNGSFNGLQIITVDTSFDQEHGLRPIRIDPSVISCAPKPTTWQGRYRLTNRDFFAAANARNTALCLAPDGWIAYVDDLSVLMPGWLARVRAAMSDNVMTFGSYMKVKKLHVSDAGEIISYEQMASGIDNRLSVAKKPVAKCGGQWCYGCSVVMPVEALLSIDGWPEALCDGMGFEDCLTGIVLENAGWPMRYDTTMMTLESEEGHHIGPNMCRQDQGISPNDKSHKALEIARASKTFDNHFRPGGIRELRRRALAGEPFPIRTQPDKEWFTKKPLSEL